MYLFETGSYIFNLGNLNAFSGTPIRTSKDGVYGSVFVNESMYEAYISATNWVTISDRIVSLTSSQVQHVIDYGTHVM